MQAEHDPDLQAQAPRPSPSEVASDLWQQLSLAPSALDGLDLPGDQSVLPSSFPVTTAAQSTLGCAALAAAHIGHLRGGPLQQVSVDAAHVVADSCGWFLRDGQPVQVWDKLSGLYPCGSQDAPGWVRIHANFAHHRDGALKLLGLPGGDGVQRQAVVDALAGWTAEGFEAAAASAGLVVAAARSFAQWDAQPQAAVLAGQPPLVIEPIPGTAADPPRPWLRWQASADEQPLRGLRVLDLTRILAGPVAGRTLAAYGADVMLVNAPHLPNIDHIADTSRGKLSAHIDLNSETGRGVLRGLLQSADVMLQGYRPGGIAARGFGPQDAAALSPGLVYVSLSAYGDSGPWGGRRGFDSLVQTATGLNLAEAQAFGQAQPRAQPFQVLDYGAAYLLALGAQAALIRQRQQGGSWHVRVTLAGVAQWLRSLGRVVPGPTVATGADDMRLFEGRTQEEDSGFGRLTVLRHAAQFSHTPPRHVRPAVPPGSSPAIWPAR